MGLSMLKRAAAARPLDACYQRDARNSSLFTFHSSLPILPSPFKLVCATVLTLLIVFAFMMKLFSKLRASRVPSSLLGMAETQPKVFKFATKNPLDPDVTIYRVEDMHCSHCEAAVVRAVEDLPGVEKAKASASANTLTIKGPATEETIRKAVEGIGYTFVGRSSNNYTSIFLISLAGTPPTIVFGSTSFVTTAPAATTAPSPIVTPASTVALDPIHTFLPIWIGA